MRYGILSDIHANLEALTTILNYLESQHIDKYVCAGDLVGYGPNPNECLAYMKNLSPLWISAGNHDWAVCGLKELSWFNEYAQKSILWTRHELSQENMIFLSELPKTFRRSDIMLVHGSPRDPLDEYLLTMEQYRENIGSLKTPLTFIGHSHVPLMFSSKGMHEFHGPETAVIPRDEEHVILNAGSVGQPRDGDNRASCAVFDSDTREFKITRHAYDISATQQKMHKARLPAFLIERLTWGK